MNLKRIVVCALMTALVASCAAGTAFASEIAPLEGRLTLYTSQPERDVTKLIAAFNERNPDVAVDVFRSGTEEVVSKVRAEHAVQSVLADVLACGGQRHLREPQGGRHAPPVRLPRDEGHPGGVPG